MNQTFFHQYDKRAYLGVNRVSELDSWRRALRIGEMMEYYDEKFKEDWQKELEKRDLEAQIIESQHHERILEQMLSPEDSEFERQREERIDLEEAANDALLDK